MSSDNSQWLRRLDILQLDGDSEPMRTAADEETLVVIIDGTHDLFGGGGSWLRRGIRQTPQDGRPVALYLPPDTPWQTKGGTGRIAVLSAKQPEAPKAEAEQPATSKKPLLQMAGSGKAFDPAQGAWLPKEAFPSSPEAILPRRIERSTVPGGVLERIIDADYKTRGLAVDELHVEPGQTIDVAPPYAAAEVGLLDLGDGSTSSAGAVEGGPEGRVCLVVYAGPKPTT